MSVELQVLENAPIDLIITTPIPQTINNQNKSVTPSETTQYITADQGYTGLGTVSVGAIASDYVGSGITRRSSSDLTASGATITAPSGYYANSASKSVSSMALPSATSASSSGTRKADIFPSTSGTTYLNIPTGYNATAQNYRIRALQIGSNKSITANGTYVAEDDDLDGFGQVTVNVPTSSVNNQNKSVTPTESQQSVTADAGYTGLGTVTVGAISSTYVGSSVPQRTDNNITFSGDMVFVDSGVYSGFEQFSVYSKSMPYGTAGTPTATKGSVSNHSITVTPSVTNTAGYISGGTKTGTEVSVSASELVSGTKSITANGTDIDVTNYQKVDVNVSGSLTPSDEGKVVVNGELVSQTSATYTANGNYDTTAIDDVTVNVDGIADLYDYAKPSGEFTTNATTLKRVSPRNNCTRIVAPNATRIESYAFEDWTGLESLDIPNVSNINANAPFKGCTKLKGLVFKKYSNNMSMQNQCIYGCSVLKYIDGTLYSLNGTALQNAQQFDTLVLRNTSVVPLANTTIVNSTPFASTGSGGTLYPPHLFELYCFIQ